MIDDVDTGGGKSGSIGTPETKENKSTGERSQESYGGEDGVEWQQGNGSPRNRF